MTVSPTFTPSREMRVQDAAEPVIDDHAVTEMPMKSAKPMRPAFDACTVAASQARSKPGEPAGHFLPCNDVRVGELASTAE